MFVITNSMATKVKAKAHVIIRLHVMIKKMSYSYLQITQKSIFLLII